MQNLGRFDDLNNHVSHLHSKGPINGLVFVRGSIGCHSPRHFISHVQKWPTLPKSDMSHSIARFVGMDIRRATSI